MMENCVQISSSQVLSMVKQELRVAETTDNDIWLDAKIEEGVRRLGTTETYVVKDCEIESENNGFDMPKEAKRIIAFRYKNNCIEGFFVDVAFFAQCGCNITGSSFIPIGGAAMQNGRRYNFINTVPDGTEFGIAYTLINRDEHGFMFINEEQELALINYVCWKYANAFVERYTPEQRASWYKDYQFQAGRCRGLAGRRSFLNQRAQISSKMNALISFTGYTGQFQGLFSQFYFTQTPLTP